MSVDGIAEPVTERIELAVDCVLIADPSVKYE